MLCITNVRLKRSKKNKRVEFIFATMMQINRNIKLIRELSGKKQAEFAGLIKIKLSNLKTYENTDVRPKANVLTAIAELAGVSLEDLDKKQLTPADIKFNWMKDEKDDKVDYTAEYIQLLKDQLKTTQERLRFQEHLDLLQTELKKNRALLTTVLEHVAKLRSSSEKKPLKEIETQMGSSYFSALGLDGKTI